jgi:hypothetical protein
MSRWKIKHSALAVIMVTAFFWTATIAQAGQNVLSWVDNSSNELNFDIQRTTAANVAACQAASGFTALAQVGANIMTYTDAALAEGATYCYRIDASNTSGVSTFSNIAGRTVPFTVPNAPSGLSIN